MTPQTSVILAYTTVTLLLGTYALKLLLQLRAIKNRS